jgi:hypothetical protein
MSLALFGIVRSGQVKQRRPSATPGRMGDQIGDDTGEQTGRWVAHSSEVWTRRLERLSHLLEMSGEESLASGGF